MSIGGPSALGTLMVQRLDAVLGTPLSQQANVASGARPDAVTQAGQPERADAVRNEILRDPRTNVDRVLEQSRQQTNQQTVDRAKLDARAAALLASRGLVSTGTTSSAPTSLGQAARAILALLANYPDQNAAVQGKAPMLHHRPGTANTQPGSITGNNVNTTANSRQDAATNSANRTAGGSPLPAAGSNTAAASVTGNSIIPTAGIAGQLTQALTQILQNSGMFYESHLNNLAFGKQTLAQLQQEPQAQAGRPPAAPQGNTPQANTAPGPANTATENSSSARSEGSSPTSTGSNPTSTPTAPVPGVDPQTHILVRQQLEVLANQTFAWRGEVWPDAPMEWEVSRHENPSQDPEDTEAQTHWATKITIHLPQLGSVQARLTLSGQQVVMHVIAPESSQLLSEHTETLRERCSGQGLLLSQLSIASGHPDANTQEVDHDDPAATRTE